MSNIDLLPSRLKMLRQGAGLTQGQLAEKSGVSQSQISAIENGDYNVRVKTLALLADALNINMSDFFIQFNKTDECKADSTSGEYDISLEDLYQYEIYKAYYPPKVYNTQISTLLEFIVYLPLIEPWALYSALQRIGGVFDRRETYISKCFADIIRDIPKCPEKDYADHVYSILQQRNDTHSIDLSSYSDEILNNYNAYNNLIEKKKMLHLNIMDILPLAAELGSRSILIGKDINHNK